MSKAIDKDPPAAKKGAGIECIWLVKQHERGDYDRVASAR
jgi:hypothetical protein